MLMAPEMSSIIIISGGINWLKCTDMILYSKNPFKYGHLAGGNVTCANKTHICMNESYLPPTVMFIILDIYGSLSTVSYTITKMIYCIN